MGVTVQFEVPGADGPGSSVQLTANVVPAVVQVKAAAVAVPNEMKQYVEAAYAYVDAAAAAANTSELNAAASESSAANSASAALVSEQKALASEQAAKASEVALASSQSAALLSEQASLASQQAAKTSELSAASSAQASSTSASESSASAAAALVSEQASKSSELASKTSETNAKQSDLAAASSASAASISQSAAAASENSAAVSATAAQISEQNADTSEAAALVSEQKAQQWAEELEDVAVEAGLYSAKHHAAKAGASATAANVSQAAAANSATSAGTSASQAQTSASAAATSEANAQAYKDAAANSASSSLTASEAAQFAQFNAENSALEAAASAAYAGTIAGQAMIYKGPWDASTGAFPADAKLSAGWMYKVTVAGVVDGTDYKVNDSIIYNGADWDLIDNTESVTSVAGKTGAVTVTKADVGLGNVRNVAGYSYTEADALLAQKLESTATAIASNKLAIGRTISVSGDASGSVYFDGSSDVTLAVEVQDDSHNHIISNVDGLQGALDGKVGTNDTRLTDSREWTATTVSQAEAEAGTATTRRAWTAQRVRQAINAVVNAIGNATTTVKGWMSPEDKTKLNGIATGATKNATDAQLRDRATHTGTQAISTVSGLQTALDGKSATGHTHDDRYYTEAEIDAMFNGLTTTPDWTSVLNKPATATRWPAWGEVTGKPSTYTPTAHTHTIANVTGLQSALDGKAAASHSHDYVPTSRTVNGKALSANISLTAADVGAAASSHTHSISQITGVGLTRGAKDQDPNLASSHHILTQHANSPGSSYYWYITTTFYATISSTGNRAQIAVQYNGGNQVYARSCFSGTWTAWVRCDNAGITPASIGAAESSHNHSAANITSGTLAGARLPNATSTVQGAVKVRLNGTTAYFTTNGSNA